MSHLLLFVYSLQVDVVTRSIVASFGVGWRVSGRLVNDAVVSMCIPMLVISIHQVALHSIVVLLLDEVRVRSTVVFMHDCVVVVMVGLLNDRLLVQGHF